MDYGIFANKNAEDNRWYSCPRPVLVTFKGFKVFDFKHEQQNGFTLTNLDELDLEEEDILVGPVVLGVWDDLS